MNAVTMTITSDTVIDLIRKSAMEFRDPRDFDSLIEAIGEAKLVLMGEASHGTSEFYTTRAELTKRLISEKKFRFISVEGDWPSCYKVNQYIKGHTNAPESVRDLLKSFDRWPTWMWANEEIIPLLDWLKAYNMDKPYNEKVGFYGLDLYSLWESMETIFNYLEKIGSRDIDKAKKVLACFHPHDRNAQDYGVHAAFFSEDCIEEVVELLTTIQKNKQFYTDDEEEQLNLEMNAMVTVHAEEFYRAMVQGGPDSWNIRDRHMTDCLIKVMAYHGQSGKGIVWEHNTHIGDARATSMAADGEVNVGQLVREHFNEKNVFIIGFGSYQGTVIASKAWGDPFKVIDVPPAVTESWESLFHQAQPTDQYIVLNNEELPFQLIKGHRAIGVVYEPRYEQFGNYVPTNLARRYNAFIFHDQTSALHPLEVTHAFALGH
jgi:erythromycin esterase-like protein